MPRQQQYYQDPARYFTEREARKDQGLRDILNMMMMKKQQEKEQARLDWQQKFQEKQFQSIDEARKAETKYREAMRNKPPTVPSEIMQAQILVESGKYPDIGSALMAVRKIKTDEQDLKDFEARKEIEGKMKLKYALPRAGDDPFKITKEKMTSSIKKDKARMKMVLDRLKGKAKELEGMAYEKVGGRVVSTNTDAVTALSNIDSVQKKVEEALARLDGGVTLGDTGRMLLDKVYEDSRNGFPISSGDSPLPNLIGDSLAEGTKPDIESIKTQLKSMFEGITPEEIRAGIANGTIPQDAVAMDDKGRIAVKYQGEWIILE